jgi:DNA sulfur modification protein DndE
MSRRIRIAFNLAIALALAGALAASGTSWAGASARASSPAYRTGYHLGTEAYEYGLPLLDLERTFRTQTSTNVPDGEGDGPVNRFSNVRRFTVASNHTVVAPNRDTLYSIAWLDISHQPQVIHVPVIKHRFYVIPLYDAWTNNFYNVTSVPKEVPGAGQYDHTSGGNYAVVPAGWKGRLPRGVVRVVSPTDRAWVIGRTYVRDVSDLGAVRRIQDRYSITPLSRYGKRFAPTPPKHPNRHKHSFTIPGTQPGQDPLAFYLALDKMLKTFPPKPADAPLMAKFKAIGIGPGLDPRQAGLSPDELRGMRDAVTNGPATLHHFLVQKYVASAGSHNGYLVSPTGSYGTHYEGRALVDQIGLGALRSDVSIYPVAQTDDKLAPLTGATRYVVHIPAGGLPPVQAFWSLTLYDANGFFVSNRLHRYLLNKLSHLHHNPDGSIDLYIQSAEPANGQQAQNWLPSPTGQPFRMIWRLYGPGAATKGILSGSGYRLPPLQACDATGHAPDGTPCAG